MRNQLLNEELHVNVNPLNVSIKDILVSNILLTEIQAGNNKFSSYARTSLTVESLSQARARATKPEPPSQSCRARARANRFILLMSSDIQALILLKYYLAL